MRGSFGGAQQVVAEVPLPEGLEPGRLIGKSGENVKSLRRQSCAKIVVHDAKAVVSGSAHAVQLGVRLLKEQLANLSLKGGIRSGKLLAPHVLGPRFGNSADLVAFTPAPDAFVQAADKVGSKGPAFTLTASPSRPAATKTVNAPPLDPMPTSFQISCAISSFLGNGSTSQSEHKDTVHVDQDKHLLAFDDSKGLIDAASQLTRCIDTALCHTPAYDEVKLQFNFGKDLFYGMNYGTAMSVADLESRRIPNDLKTTFSNCVPSSNLQQLLEHLQGSLQDFHEVDRKESVTLHAAHRGAATVYAVSMMQEGEGRRLTLRKVKTNTYKLGFLTLLSGQVSKPDWRAKLVAQYEAGSGVIAPELQRTLEHVAAGAQLCAGLEHSKRVELPEKLMTLGGLSAHLVRIKSKRRYRGMMQMPGGADAVLVKISVTTITNQTTGHTFTEVCGAVPALNTLLSQLLAAAATSAAPPAAGFMRSPDVEDSGKDGGGQCPAGGPKGTGSGMVGRERLQEWVIALAKGLAL